MTQTTQVRIDAAGTPIFLQPPQVSSGTWPEADSRRRVLHGLLREALRASPKIDLLTSADGANPDPTSHPHRITVHVDAMANRVSTTLARPEGPIALAIVTLNDDLAAVADELARSTSAAIGDRSDRPAVGDIYSRSRRCVDWTEQALTAMCSGAPNQAAALLRRARAEDGGCTLTLMLLATCLLDGNGGDRQDARAILQQALALPQRTSPTTTHRLLRSHALATGQDRLLLHAGEVMQRERPFDAQGTYTLALAHNLSNDSARALPLLRHLQQRWPHNGAVLYQLAFAALAQEQPELALASLRQAEAHLPAHMLVRPMCLALYHSNRHTELVALLERLAAQNNVKNSEASHEIRRIRIAHALLLGDKASAVRHIVEDLVSIRQRPSRLEQFTIAVSEHGEILFRLQHAAELLTAIEGFQQLGQLPPVFATALTYLGGLITVSRGERPTAAVRSLQQDGRTAWEHMLRAADHRRRGELQQEATALDAAMRATDSPMATAAFASVMRRAGDHAKARRLGLSLRQQLVTFDQRRPYDHPLMSPARALAYVATPADGM